MTPQSVSMNQLGSAPVRRRWLLGGLLAPMVLFFANRFGTASAALAAPVAAGPSDEELKPFRDIAARKGAKYVYGSSGRIASVAGGSIQMHLDMDMVRASIDNAIARARKEKRTAILERLERLRSNGTAAQQVDFVLGPGDKYFFPEDVEKWAAQAEADKFTTFGVVCDRLCWVVCKCSCWKDLKDCVQECQERCRDIFC